jgi:hypothetical protein
VQPGAGHRRWYQVDRRGIRGARHLLAHDLTIHRRARRLNRATNKTKGKAK